MAPEMVTMTAPPIIGRDADLARLDERLNEVRAGARVHGHRRRRGGHRQDPPDPRVPARAAARRPAPRGAVRRSRQRRGAVRAREDRAPHACRRGRRRTRARGRRPRACGARCVTARARGIRVRRCRRSGRGHRERAAARGHRGAPRDLLARAADRLRHRRPALDRRGELGAPPLPHARARFEPRAHGAHATAQTTSRGGIRCARSSPRPSATAGSSAETSAGSLGRRCASSRRHSSSTTLPASAHSTRCFVAATASVLRRRARRPRRVPR